MPAKSVHAKSTSSASSKRGAPRSSSRPSRSKAPTRARPRPESSLPPTVNAVIERLGRALGAGDLPSVAGCFAYPSLFLTGADTHEFRDPRQVQTVFAAALEGQAALDVVERRPEVESVAPLGNGIYGCTVRWPGFGADGKRILEETAHYLVQESAVGTALIRVAVAVDAPSRRDS